MDQDFEQELLEIFKAEAEDYLTILTDGLTALDEQFDAQTIEEMFRTTHSLKGAARAVNFSAVEELCQVLETLFSKIKNNALKLNDAILEVMNKAIDHLTELLQQNNFDISCDLEILEAIQSASNGQIKTTSNTKETSPKNEQKKQQKDKPKQGANTTSVPDAKQQTIRISYQKLHELFTQSENLINIKIKYLFYLNFISDITDRLEQLFATFRHDFLLSSENKKYVSPENINFLMKQLEKLKKDGQKLQKQIEIDHFQIVSMIDHHLEDIKQLMMFPFSTITNYLERSTRTIAREMNKQISLKIYGKEIEIDKHTLELLKDPLIHLIRNSLDHGIEPAEERKMRGKPEVGTITIEVLPPRDQKIVIKISDDGRGLDLEKIKAKALEKRLVSPAELNKMEESQILSLIFRSGFSTKSNITKLSGRGLGMAVVLENIEKLSGSLKVENYFPNGSAFFLTIPLSFATSRGILISSAHLTAVIPTKFVRQPLRVQANSLKTVEQHRVVQVNGQNIPLFSLAALLKLAPTNHTDPSYLNILILKLEDQQQIAISVDQILDEREIILKKLNPPLEQVPFLSGMTILGDGTLVPVLNIHDIFHACENLGHQQTDEKELPKKILAVEDSITSRVLLKNLLESAGFEVKTASNGKQAWQFLQQESFDLIVSDVEMPEMNGIDLTQKVKSDEKLKKIPLILLTSLGSEEDKKKGLEAGANAYFVKQNFKQKSLLDLVQKLI